MSPLGLFLPLMQLLRVFVCFYECVRGASATDMKNRSLFISECHGVCIKRGTEI